MYFCELLCFTLCPFPFGEGRKCEGSNKKKQKSLSEKNMKRPNGHWASDEGSVLRDHYTSLAVSFKLRFLLEIKSRILKAQQIFFSGAYLYTCKSNYFFFLENRAELLISFFLNNAYFFPIVKVIQEKERKKTHTYLNCRLKCANMWQNEKM